MLEVTRKAMQAAYERKERERQKAEEKTRAILKKKWSEKLVAKHLVECVKEAGGFIVKMHPLTNAGIPDYLIIIHGRTLFVETKTTGEHCTPIQEEFHKILKKHNVETYVLDTKITNFYDLYTWSYKTYADPDDKRHGINRLKEYRK